MREQVKHKILRLLNEFDLIDDEQECPIRGALSIADIGEKLNISIECTAATIEALNHNNHITEINNDPFDRLYRITSKGRIAFNEEFYRSEFLDRFRRGLVLFSLV